MSPPSRSESGQATILIVGLATVLAMGVAVVTDASAAYLQRQGLDNLADGAALAGADLGAAGDDVYTGGIGDIGGTASPSPRPRRERRSRRTSSVRVPTPSTPG